MREKAYGNRDQADYLDWLTAFARQVRRVLRDDGSFVLNLGGAYQRGVPARSLYPFRVLLRFCDEVGFFLAEDVYWHNPAKLPSPIEWVNKRKIRMKDSINTVALAQVEPRAPDRVQLGAAGRQEGQRHVAWDAEREALPRGGPHGCEQARQVWRWPHRPGGR